MEDRVDANSNRSLNAVVESFQTVFNHPAFPTEFVPSANWVDAIEVQPPVVFDDRLVEFEKMDKHPFAWAAMERVNPDFENSLRTLAQVCTTMVDFGDPQNPRILLRGTKEYQQARAADIVFSLGGALGRFAAPTIEEPITQSQIELSGLKDQLREVAEQGYNCDLSELRFRRQSCTEFITLERRRLQMIGRLGKSYGNFLAELYSDIYSTFLFTNLVSIRSGMSHKEATLRYQSQLAVKSTTPFRDVPDQTASNAEQLQQREMSIRGGWGSMLSIGFMQYNFRLLEYVQHVGWVDLIRGGITSDTGAFLRAGTEVVGEDENKRFLDELQTLRSRFTGTTFY